MLPYRTSSNFNPGSPQHRDCPHSAPHVFGSHIFSIHESEDLRKHKQMQKQVYYQELTRQIQEKHEKEPPRLANESLPLNFPQEVSYPWDGGNLPKYQKKYQIENHSSLYGNQVLGGALQRDETQLLKNKKEQQQREMQEFLKIQIEEKQKLRELKRRDEELQSNNERKMTCRDPFYSNELSDFLSFDKNTLDKDVFGTQEFTTSDKDFQGETPTNLGRMNQNAERNQFTNEDLERHLFRNKDFGIDKNELTSLRMNRENESKDENTFKEDTFEGKQQQELEDDKGQEKDRLAQLCQELMSEQEKLKGMIKMQEGVIEGLKVKEEGKPPKPRNTAARRHTANNRTTLKIKHEEEKARISAIDTKIENARKRKIEQSQKRKESSKHSNIVRANSEKTDNAKDTAIVRMKSAQINNQWNLDVSAKSTFIYPSPEGHFAPGNKLNEESPVPEFSATSFVTFPVSDRRDCKPMIAKGFPPGIFRRL